MNLNFNRVIDLVVILIGFIGIGYGLWTQDVKCALVGVGLAFIGFKLSN